MSNQTATHPKNGPASVAIVTGASQGIGRATAIRLASDFPTLVLVARNEASLESTADAVRTAGAEALVIAADLATPTAARTVIDRALAAHGRIDALLNIAVAPIWSTGRPSTT